MVEKKKTEKKVEKKTTKKVRLKVNLVGVGKRGQEVEIDKVKGVSKGFYEEV